MKLIKSLAAGLFLITGVPLLIGMMVLYIANPSASQKDKEGAIAAMVLFGLPPTGLGAWLVWSLNQQKKQEAKAHEYEKEQLFLDVLQANNGSITAIRFASEANIPVADAKQYLDRKAQELNAIVDITEQGGMVYRFPI
ncbi:MAG TPA: hypothetical protein V6C78_16680 [Crinalium sp.]|jgi:predicted transcriptional regulator